MGLFSPGNNPFQAVRGLWTMSKMRACRTPTLPSKIYPAGNLSDTLLVVSILDIFMCGRFISLKGIKKNFVFECSHDPLLSCLHQYASL